VYPVGVEDHRRLVERGRALSMARVRVAPRNIDVGLMAVPLGGSLASSSAMLEAAVKRIT
jgi:hypothetical protein